MTRVRVIPFDNRRTLVQDLGAFAVSLPERVDSPGLAALFHGGDEALRQSLAGVTTWRSGETVAVAASREALGDWIRRHEADSALSPWTEKLRLALQGLSGDLPLFLDCPRGRLDLGGRPKVMGILNVTPDSFSDGGRFEQVEAALAHALRMAQEGADLIDIGGESSRPGAAPVSVEEELARVIPVIRALRGAVDLPLSIDTTKAQVAREAIGAGADLINDISGLESDPDMAHVAADLGVPVVLMHMQGTPETMQRDPRYQDLMGDIYDSLARSIDRAETAGVWRSQIVVDPGIGFGKQKPDNFVLLRRLHEFLGLGCGLLLGASRKSFIGWALDRSESERLPGSLAAAVSGALSGAHILRVHDVLETVDAVEIAWRIRSAAPQSASSQSGR